MHAERSGAEPPVAPKHRVVIVDDHGFFAGCLRALLENESDIVVCDVAGSPEELSDRLNRLDPDVLVIDLSLGAESGLWLGRQLRHTHGIKTPILFISSVTRPSRGQLGGVGRCAYVAKSGQPAELLRILRQMVADRAVPAFETGLQLELVGIQESV